MHPDELVAALTAYAEAKQARDLEATMAMFHEDGTYQSIGFGPVVRGKAALTAFFGSLFTAVPDYYGAYEGTAYSTDTAVVWGHWGGTIAGDFLGLGTVPGRRLEIPVTFVCTFRDGLLAREVGYFDAATFAEQAGIALPDLGPRSGSASAQLTVS